MSDYIPPELISNILARLPVDTVLRCTSVCKSWYSLITCPSFASSYHNLFPPNQEPRLLVRQIQSDDCSRMSYSVRHDNQTFDKVAELDYPCPDYCIEVDSINGLLCFFDMSKKCIMLWNPSLRKLLILPKTRALSDPWFYPDLTVGFGFVASSNEYKIVTFRNDPPFPNARLTAEIYELSTGSWRDLKLEDDSSLYVSYRQAHLNGILHWYMHGSEQGNLNFICSFDMKNETFGDLMVPSCLRNAFFFPSTFRESLRLVENDDDKLCSIWVMKEYGVPESWEKFFVIDRKQHDLTTFPRTIPNGELLFGKSYDGHCLGRVELVLYDCKNNQVKNLGVLAHVPKYYTFSVYPYLESLALMKGLNEGPK